MIVLTTNADGLKKIHQRGINRGVDLSLYIEDMFTTGYDEANRAAVRQYGTDELQIAGLALHEDRKIVDKITKGARMHS